MRWAPPASRNLGFRFAELIKRPTTSRPTKAWCATWARKYGAPPPFNAKPVFGDNGSGMHVPPKPLEGRQPLFFGEGTYAKTSPRQPAGTSAAAEACPLLSGLHQPRHSQLQAHCAGFEKRPVTWCNSRATARPAVRIPLSGSHRRQTPRFRMRWIALAHIPTWPSRPAAGRPRTAIRQARSNRARASTQDLF